MKLRKREIEVISQHVVNSLIENKLTETDDQENMEAEVAKVITAELRVEDQLNDEVRKILEEHSSEISSSKIEYHNAFNLVKKKLIRERNMIL